MRTDKQEAIYLRLQGKSYTEISKLLGVPKSTLSGWLTNVTLPAKAKKRIEKLYRVGSYKGLLQKATLQTELAVAKSTKIRLESEKDIGYIGTKELFFIGLGLYLGEGYKKAITKMAYNARTTLLV